MVIVQSRVTGAYYNGARSNHGFRSGEWVADMQQCLPYKNRRGAIGALGNSCRRREDGYKFDAAFRKYEIVPVKLVLEN